MVLCDRCKRELSYKERETAETHITWYKAEGAYIGKFVDLCPECKRLREDFLQKMDSYFMFNEDPKKILEGKVFWRNNI